MSNHKTIKAAAYTALTFGIAAAFAPTASAADGDLTGSVVTVGNAEAQWDLGAAIASDAAGNTVTVWVDNTGNLQMRRYDKNGSALGNAVQLSKTPIVDYPTAQTFPVAVAMNKNGQFTVSWVEQLGYKDIVFLAYYFANPSILHAQTFNADGTPNSADTQVATTPHYNYNLGGPSLAIDDNGNFAVSWLQSKEPTVFPFPTWEIETTTAYVRTYSAAGVAKTSAVVVDSGSNSTSPKTGIQTGHQIWAAPAVGMDSVGNFTVAWAAIDLSSTAKTSSVFTRSYHADGSANASKTTIQSTTASISPAPLASIGMNASGAYVVAWNSFDSSAGTARALAQSFQANGTASGGVVNITSDIDTTLAIAEPSVAITDSGNFIAGTRFNSSGTFTNFQNVVRAFKADGSALGGSTYLLSDGTNPQSSLANGSLAVTTDSSGDAAAAYTDFDYTKAPLTVGHVELQRLVGP